MKNYLKNCPGCAKEVPDWEIECPHCGAWLSKEKKPEAKFQNREEYEKWKEEKIKESKELKEELNEVELDVQPVHKTNKIIMLSVAVGILLMSLSIGYYYVIHSSQKELQEQLNKEQKETGIHEEKAMTRGEMQRSEDMPKQNIEEERLQRDEFQIGLEDAREKQKALQAQREKKARTDKCLYEAYKRYMEKWNESCIEEGLESNCLLPEITARDYNLVHEQDRSRCYNENE
jgi:hypothetical protein